METTKYGTTIYEKDGNVATIVMNRPEKLNTWDWPGQGGLTDDFSKALTLAEEDDEIKVVIIKGAGRCFCAGHDLTTVGFVYGMGTGQPGERRANQRIRLDIDRKHLDLHKRLFLFPKLTIAQVHGYCIGEGLLLVEECDCAIVAEDAQIGHVDNRLGFAGLVGTMNILIMTVGLKRALDLLLTGRIIDGKEAERIGLVTKAVPADLLSEEVNRAAQTFCLLPRDGIAIGKAARHSAYGSLGLLDSYTNGYIGHTLFTNLSWEPDEYNFFKERRDKGAKAGFHGLHARY